VVNDADVGESAKWSKASYVSSPVVDEEWMRLGQWLELVLCIPFGALTLMVGWQEGHVAHKNLITRGSLPDEVAEDDPVGTS